MAKKNTKAKAGESAGAAVAEPATPTLTCRGCGCSDLKPCRMKVGRVFIPCAWATGVHSLCTCCVVRLPPLYVAALVFGPGTGVELAELMPRLRSGQVQSVLERFVRERLTAEEAMAGIEGGPPQ